jgi:pyruvate formate lyase activating enzyme
MFPPAEAVRAAKDNGCQGVSYTYTEPTVFFEYSYDTAKIAASAGLFNTFVTNGYLTPEAVKTISPYLDAATVDFKGAADPEFYAKVCSVPSVDPIFESLVEMKRRNIHIEVTNLIIPKVGDSVAKLRGLAEWITENLGENVPFHLLRFHPNYKMSSVVTTPMETIEKAYFAAREAGLNYVYIGNAPGHRFEHTYCPQCSELLIKRFSFEIVKWNLTKTKQCPTCGHVIPVKGEKHSTGAIHPYTLF